MSTITIAPEIWATAALPEGILEKWRVTDGSLVAADQVVAEISVEGAKHEVLSPTAGRVQVWMRANSVVEPGSQIGAVG